MFTTDELTQEVNTSINNIDEQVESFLILLDAELAPRRNVVVLVNMPHLRDFGHSPIRELVYKYTFDCKVGDLVVCPATQFSRGRTFVGQVVSFNSSYSGYMRELVRLADSGKS